MPPAGNNRQGSLKPSGAGWWFHNWGPASVIAGITDRTTQRQDFLAHAQAQVVAEADQVHGASTAAIDQSAAPSVRVTGCDALITGRPGVALLARTADCLPVFFAHQKRAVVAVAHAGWRGLALNLPVRVLADFWNLYRCPADQVEVAIGPAIRACCYTVGPEFKKIFSVDMVARGGKLACDLVAAATRQLMQAGVPKTQILDTGLCTACGNERWYSLRCEGASTGRLTSLIMVKE